MNNRIKSLHLPLGASTGGAVLRAGTLALREERKLVVVSASGAHFIPVGWQISNHELTPDGQFVLALGDDARRAAVWETETGKLLLNIAGNDKRQSLRAGVARIGADLYAFKAVRNEDVSIIAVRDGTERGWLGTTGAIWFHLLRITQIEGDWLAIHGYHGDDQYDTIVALPARDLLQDPMLLYAAVTESPNVKEWGYRVAVGPAGMGRIVMFRDPKWGDKEEADDPAESFRGLVFWDLTSKRILQRIEYDSNVKDGATLGADEEHVAIEVDQHIDVVTRSTGAVARLEGIALDPYRLEIARVMADTIEIVSI